MTGSDPQRTEATDVSSQERQRRVIGLGSATGICVASMIGMGIFTVTGVVGADLGSASNLMLAWVIAGIVALASRLKIAVQGSLSDLL